MIPKWQKYDPTWLVELARKQYPEDSELLEGLKKCTQQVGECSCGCGEPYFIDPSSTDWQHARCVQLAREDGVSIIVDIQKDGRVGFVEIGEWEKKH